ncbi:MAG: AraC family transcriptional regulator [Prevotella sp.]|nr:AraC family transcriptional regulator [Prevotella sp.]
MYRLRDFLQSVAGLPSEAVTSDNLYCYEANFSLSLITNKMKEALGAYSYTLVRQGWISLTCNNRRLTLQPGDLYIYSPGYQITILDGSEDYSAVCLLADEQITLESPAIWNIIRTAYYPVSELGRPVLKLSIQQADLLCRRMQEIKEYQHSHHHFLGEVLHTLYTLFLLDLMNVMEQRMAGNQYSERTTEIFMNFMRLLTKHFVEHHDIGYYADQLHITTTHLSRIVRQITGRTVMDHINQMLLMEASWLLQVSSLSVSAVAERLHFADQSSFSKFFLRMKGTSPKKFRARR